MSFSNLVFQKAEQTSKIKETFSNLVFQKAKQTSKKSSIRYYTGSKTYAGKHVKNSLIL